MILGMINTRQVIITITEATCGRCGHRWELKRTDADGKVLIPKACPVCHSPYWNRPRKYRKPDIDADAETLPPLDGEQEAGTEAGPQAEAQAVEAPTERPFTNRNISDLMSRLNVRKSANTTTNQ